MLLVLCFIAGHGRCRRHRPPELPVSRPRSTRSTAPIKRTNFLPEDTSRRMPVLLSCILLTSFLSSSPPRLPSFPSIPIQVVQCSLPNANSPQTYTIFSALNPVPQRHQTHSSPAKLSCIPTSLTSLPPLSRHHNWSVFSSSKLASTLSFSALLSFSAVSSTLGATSSNLRV